MKTNNLITLTDDELQLLLSLCMKEIVNNSNLAEDMKKYCNGDVDKEIEARGKLCYDIMNKLKDSKNSQNKDNNELIQNIENHRGCLDTRYFKRVEGSLALLETMYMPASIGFTDNGKSYEPICFVVDRDQCYEALNVVKKFIDVFAPRIEEKERKTVYEDLVGR